MPNDLDKIECPHCKLEMLVASIELWEYRDIECEWCHGEIKIVWDDGWNGYDEHPYFYIEKNNNG